MKEREIKYYEELMERVCRMSDESGLDDYFVIRWVEERHGKFYQVHYFGHMDSPPLFASRSLPYRFKAAG